MNKITFIIALALFTSCMHNNTKSDTNDSLFDKSTIKGLVAELITIPKEKIDTSLALEITAGGRLYNVRNRPRISPL